MEIKKRGIIFALDAALAVSVVIIILINSSYYFSTSTKESLSQLQPVRIGSDIMALLDFQGNFDYAFAQDVEDARTAIPQSDLNVSSYLPRNYAMRYLISDMKETPLTSAKCPSSLCSVDTGVACDTSGCTLPPGASISVRPFTLPDYADEIQNPGQHFVSVGTTKHTDTLYLEINVDGNSTYPQITFDKDTGIYFWGSLTNFPYFEAGSSDNNIIKLTNMDSQSITLTWVRVVGDTSYMRGAYSDSTTTSLPLDRFLGTGERFIGVITPSGDFEGHHLIRYWVWLKTVNT